MDLDSFTSRITGGEKITQRALYIGLAGLALSGLGLLFQPVRFFYAYLLSVVFWVTIALGALFFVMLHHLVGAKWSIVLRRITENVMAVIPVMAVLFLPVLFGIQHLYHWSHADVVAGDPILQQKSGYLNITFFILRSLIYFAVWTLIAWRLLRVSLRQDEGHTQSITVSMKKWSAAGMLLFAFTLTFAGFDWLMSLEAHWYSTIFGVYVFSGSLPAILAALTLIAIFLRNQGILTNKITIEHFHDLGKLMFGFTIFWAYIAFSQFMLIWYGNIPEETLWYKHRWEDPAWRVISLVLLFGHFLIPFLALITRAAKRNLRVLQGVAAWLLVMHFVDLYWLILPNYDHHRHVSWMDLTALVGVGGIFLWYFSRLMFARPILPVNDPNLEASVKFENQ